MGDDGVGAAQHDVVLHRRQLAGELHLHTLGGKLNRREWVFDFMRQAPRHLAPGRRTLRGHEAGNLVAHQQIPVHRADAAVRRFEPRIACNHRRTRAAQQQGLVRFVAIGEDAFELQLLLPVVAFLERLPRRFEQGRERAVGATRVLLRLVGNRINAQNLRCALIGGDHMKRRVEHNHASGEIGQNAFQVRLRVLQFALLGFDRHARVAQLPRHAIKALREHAQFVFAGEFGARFEVAFGDRFGAFGQHFERRGKARRLQDRRAQGREQSEHQHQRERDRKNLAQARAREHQFLVIAIALAHRFGGVGQRIGYRRNQLEQAWFGGERGARPRRDWHQHTHA